MSLTKKINWNNLHIYFFYLFLFSIPFQTRKVFLTKYSFYSDSFTEYATFFVYASDVLLIFTLIFWLFFNKKLYKYLNLENLKNARKLPPTWLLLLVFIFWLFISAIINNNYVEISAFYILKFIELSLLIIYIYFNLRNKHKLITAFFTIAFAGFFQALIAIYQFIYQCPLFKHPFLHKLTGESTVYPQILGIAKIVVDNEKFIRAYGTFPHPNILSGFLIISILISIYLLLEHKSYILSIINFKHNNINSNKSQVKTLSLLLSLFWIILIFTQITALLFTFSRIAWFSFLISLFLMIIFYVYRFKIVSRETISEKTGINYYYSFHHFKELIIIILLTLILVTIYFPHINSRINEELLVNNYSSLNYLPSNYAFNDRVFYNNVSRETISKNFILGSCPGTFIFQINNYLTKNNINQKLEPWQYQPAHNVYLLIISEIGIVGFIIFSLFIIKIVICNLKIIKKTSNKHFSSINSSNNFSIVSRETIFENLSPDLNYYLLAIFTSFLFIGFFDHHFWTLQQGRLIFWLILGLMLVSVKMEKK